MELEHLEVRVLNALIQLGPPQVESLAAHTDEAAACFSNGLLVAYDELTRLSFIMAGNPWRTGLRAYINERAAIVFELYCRLTRREAVIAACERPLLFCGEGDDGDELREHLAEGIAFVWREVTRDVLPLDGPDGNEPDRELENVRLAPHLAFLDVLVREAQEREAQEEIYEQKVA